MRFLALLAGLALANAVPATRRETAQISRLGAADRPQLTGACSEPLCGATADYWYQRPWSEVARWLQSVVDANPSWRDAGVAAGKTPFERLWWDWYVHNASAAIGAQVADTYYCQVDRTESCAIPWEALDKTRRDSILGHRVLQNLQRLHHFISNDYALITDGAIGFVSFNADTLWNAFETGLYSDGASVEVKNFGSSIGKLVGGLASGTRAVARKAKEIVRDAQASAETIKAAESWLVPLDSVVKAAKYLSKLNIGLTVAAALLGVLVPPPPPVPALVPGAALKQELGSWLSSTQTSFGASYNLVFGGSPTAAGGLLDALKDGKWDLPFELSPGGSPQVQQFKSIVAARYFNIMAAKKNIFFQVARNGVPCTKDIAVFCYDAVEGSGDQSLNVRVVQLSLDSWGQPSTDLAPAYKFDGTFADVLGVDTPINLRQAVLSSMKCQKAIEDSNGRFYTPWNSLMDWDKQAATYNSGYKYMTYQIAVGALNLYLRDDMTKLFDGGSAYPPADFSDYDPATMKVTDIPCLFSIPIVETPTIEPTGSVRGGTQDGLYLRYAASAIRAVVAQDYGTATDVQGWSTTANQWEPAYRGTLSADDINLLCSTLNVDQGKFDDLGNVMYVPCAMSCKARFTGGAISEYDAHTDYYASGCYTSRSNPGFPNYWNSPFLKAGSDGKGGKRGLSANVTV